VDATGAALTQKRHPQLALLQPRIDLAAGLLEVHAPHMREPLRLAIAAASSGDCECCGGCGGCDKRSSCSDGGNSDCGANERDQLSVRVCGDAVCALVRANAGTSSASAGAAEWLRCAVGVPCQLVQQLPRSRSSRAGTAGHGPSAAAAGAAGSAGSGSPRARARAGLGFANDGQFLLVNEASVAAVAEAVAARASAAVATDPRRGAVAVTDGHFRPNLVVAAAAAGADVQLWGDAGGGAGNVTAQPPPAGETHEHAAGSLPADVSSGRLLSAFAEDCWGEVRVGGVALSMLAPCPRCEVLQVDQASGRRRGADVLAVLASRGRQRQRLAFGVLLQQQAVPGGCQGSGMLRVGDPVWPSFAAGL
jgi:hypothetical protein